MIGLAAGLSLLIGAIVGLLGGGGSILTLPMLVYLLGMDGREGIPSSLFVVAVTSGISAIAHARHGNVRWRIGTFFGAAGMSGAYVAGSLAKWIPTSVLLILFGLVMLITAMAMLRGGTREALREGDLSLAKVLLLGVAVGVVSGLVGAGGGFLIVPALSLLGGLAMAQAVGTSLFVIALQAFAGFFGHSTHATLNWSLLTVITVASVAGSFVGTELGRRLSSRVLKESFAWLVLFMALFVIGSELPSQIFEHPLVRVGGAVALVSALIAGPKILRDRVMAPYRAPPPSSPPTDAKEAPPSEGSARSDPS